MSFAAQPSSPSAIAVTKPGNVDARGARGGARRGRVRSAALEAAIGLDARRLLIERWLQLGVQRDGHRLDHVAIVEGGDRQSIVGFPDRGSGTALMIPHGLSAETGA